MSEIIHVILDGEHKKIRSDFIQAYMVKYPHAVSFETESEALDYLNAVKEESPPNKNILVESEDLTDNKQNKRRGIKKGQRIKRSPEHNKKISAALKGNKNAKK